MLEFAKRHLPLTLSLGLVAAYAVYQVAALFFAYTSDAYVTSDTVAIAPQVAGHIAEMPVIENQRVEAGDLLFQIDRRPYELAVRQRKAAVALAQASLSEAKGQVGLAHAQRAAKQAQLDDAKGRLDRIEALFKKNDASAQTLNDSQRTFAVATAELQAARAAETVAQDGVSHETAALDAAQAALALAEYNLEKTSVLSPASGRLAPFRVRAGDYVKPGEAVMAVVADSNWRVVANLKDVHLHGLSIGQPVWFTIANDPWRLHRGTLVSVAPGVARNPAPYGVLPYVDPSTDWVRLSRRFPARIDPGDLPQREAMYHGTNARVFMFLHPRRSAP
jgi:multidrug efflux system membrane fusion protein